MRLPVALELLELLATVNIPQADRLVTRPTDKLPRIRRVEMDAKDRTAAIFEVSGNTFVMVVYASPPLSGGGVVPTHAKLATFRTMRSPVALERVQALAC